MGLIADRKAEMSVIGIAMSFPDTLERIAGLDNGLFGHLDTQNAHKGIQSMVQEHRPVDVVTLSAEMEKTSLSDMTAFLMECCSTAYTSTNLGEYEARLLDLKKRRDLSLAASEIVQKAADPNTSVDTLCEIARNSSEFTEGAKATVSSADALMAFMERMDNAKKSKRQTGIDHLDKITGGFRGGHLIILAARPAVGKSALATQIATHIAGHYKGDDGKGGTVLFVSLEMGEDEITSRIVANIGDVDASLLETGTATADDMAKAAKSYGFISKLPIQYSTRANTPLQIRRIASHIKSRSGLSMIVVDYLQLMHSDSKTMNRNEEVGEISRSLKALAMDLDVPILALSQFNRQSEMGSNGQASRRKPQMSEARESGSIEQDANMFLTLWEPPEPTDVNSSIFSVFHTCQANGWQMLCISIDKNRGGRTGNALVAFDKPHLRFSCIE